MDIFVEWLLMGLILVYGILIGISSEYKEKILYMMPFTILIGILLIKLYIEECFDKNIEILNQIVESLDALTNIKLD